MPGYSLKTLSVGKSSIIVDFCEKTLAMELIQDGPFSIVSCLVHIYWVSIIGGLMVVCVFF